MRLARLLVDDRETAEDVVQDAFAAMHRRWASITSEDAALTDLPISIGPRTSAHVEVTAHDRAADAHQLRLVGLCWP